MDVVTGDLRNKKEFEADESGILNTAIVTQTRTNSALTCAIECTKNSGCTALVFKESDEAPQCLLYGKTKAPFQRNSTVNTGDAIYLKMKHQYGEFIFCVIYVYTYVPSIYKEHAIPIHTIVIYSNK